MNPDNRNTEELFFFAQANHPQNLYYQTI